METLELDKLQIIKLEIKTLEEKEHLSDKELKHLLELKNQLAAMQLIAEIDQLPATAAGEQSNQDNTGNDSHPVVSIDYLNPTMTPDSGFNTIGPNIVFNESKEPLILNPQHNVSLNIHDVIPVDNHIPGLEPVIQQPIIDNHIPIDIPIPPVIIPPIDIPNPPIDNHHTPDPHNPPPIDPPPVIPPIDPPVIPPEPPVDPKPPIDPPIDPKPPVEPPIIDPPPVNPPTDNNGNNGQNPGNDKPVGNSPWDGHTGASNNQTPTDNGNPNMQGNDNVPNQPPGFINHVNSILDNPHHIT